MAIIMMIILFVLFVCTPILMVYGQQNIEAEAICAPFLTSPQTTPLDPAIKRNLTLDENAEFECEIVLQDANLPVQIRGTIHEGLSYLAVRHVQKMQND